METNKRNSKIITYREKAANISKHKVYAKAKLDEFNLVDLMNWPEESKLPRNGNTTKSFGHLLYL